MHVSRLATRLSLSLSLSKIEMFSISIYELLRNAVLQHLDLVFGFYVCSVLVLVLLG